MELRRVLLPLSINTIKSLNAEDNVLLTGSFVQGGMLHIKDYVHY